MTTLTMSPTLGDLLKYELNANYCRETVTLKSGASYTTRLGTRQDHGFQQISPLAGCRSGGRRGCGDRHCGADRGG